jgi:hypothetical protein
MFFEAIWWLGSKSGYSCWSINRVEGYRYRAGWEIFRQAGEDYCCARSVIVAA